jgi:tetratricopeptide (TPR) repeat protein
LSLISFDETSKLYRIPAPVRNFAEKQLKNPTKTLLRLANNCAEIAEYCAWLAERGSDGVYLSLGIFDDHKFYIKQTLSWLIQNKPLPIDIDKLIFKFSRIITALGRLRFIRSLESIPLMRFALEIALKLEDFEAAFGLLENLGRTYYILGDGQMALTYYDQQLNLIREHGDLQEEPTIVHNMMLAQKLLDESL